MYYNPSTDRAIDIEVIAQQCRDAITRGRVHKGTYAPNVIQLKQETTSK
jgi:hypothetical protein